MTSAAGMKQLRRAELNSAAAAPRAAPPHAATPASARGDGEARGGRSRKRSRSTYAHKFKILAPSVLAQRPQAWTMFWMKAGPYAEEFSSHIPTLDYDPSNPMFGVCDATVLYSFVRAYKPKRIVEIGSGFSTRVVALANRQNMKEGHFCEHTCIEPYRSSVLQGLNITLIAKTLQETDVNLFLSLTAGDLLEVRSHTRGVVWLVQARAG